MDMTGQLQDRANLTPAKVPRSTHLTAHLDTVLMEKLSFPSIEHPDVTNNKTSASIYEIIRWNEYALISHKTFQTLVNRF